MADTNPLLPAPPKPPAGPVSSQDEEAFRLLVDSVTDYAIFMLDPAGRVQSWNAGAQRIKGYAAEEIIGRSFEVFYPREVAARGWPREELKIAATQGRLEDQGWRMRKDGSRFWADVVITALRAPDGTLRGFAKVTRDCTQRRRQEEALRQSEEQFRLLVESVKDYAIFLLDPKGRVLTWNAGAAAIKGYAADDVLLRHFSMFFTAEDVAAGKPQQELVTALEKGHAHSEGYRVRKDGSLFWADVVLTPVVDHDGVLRGFAKVTRDLSAQRRLAELERASQRMNEFIAMLAHELRNPLAPIRNAVSVLKVLPNLPPAAAQINEIVDRQSAQLTRLVGDLLDAGRVVSGKIRLERQQIDYREVVLASVDAVRPQAAARGHRLVLDLPEPVSIWGDAMRLTQALQNLLNNAIRYTPEGGEIRVALRDEGARSVTTVSDTGQGIVPEALERIFELFVQEDAARRTPSESGLGIGLSLARTMAELHGGRLSAFSEGLGHGSTFTLVLPTLRPGLLDAR